MSKFVLESYLLEVINNKEMPENIKLKIIEALLGQDDNVNDEKNKTLLMIASESGQKKVAEFLIANGADVNDSSWPTDYTALMFASKNGHKEVVELLIKSGADVNAKDDHGTTALMWAADFGQKEVVELLIKSGADVNAKDNGGKTVMMLTSSDEMKKVIMKAVKERNEKTNENVIVKDRER